MPITINGPKGLASFFRSDSRKTPADIPGVPRAAAGFTTLKQSLFNARIERHIDDVRAGQGRLSSEVAVELALQDQETSTSLASSNPEAASRYAAYSTLLAYDKKARFVSSVGLTSKSLNEIPSEEEAKAATDELVKAFYPER